MCVCHLVDVCVEGWGAWLFPVGEWQIKGGRSASQEVTMGTGWGQIRGKYFSINSFTAAISCRKTKEEKKRTDLSSICRFNNIADITNSQNLFGGIPEDWSCEGALGRFGRWPSEGWLWIGVSSPSFRRTHTGSCSPSCHGTAGSEGSCCRLMPARQNTSTVSLQHRNFLISQAAGEKQHHFFTIKLSVPMGRTCEVVASNWAPQRQPADAGRSRRYTRTEPHPEETDRQVV